MRSSGLNQSFRVSDHGALSCAAMACFLPSTNSNPQFAQKIYTRNLPRIRTLETQTLGGKSLAMNMLIMYALKLSYRGIHLDRKPSQNSRRHSSHCR